MRNRWNHERSKNEQPLHKVGSPYLRHNMTRVMAASSVEDVRKEEAKGEDEAGSYRRYSILNLPVTL